ncbi:MAG TPA: hypothetical protein ACQGQG_10020, partial [Xylella sp.]
MSTDRDQASHGNKGSGQVCGSHNALKVQQKILRRRLRTYRLRDQMKVWYGLDPIPFIWLKPKATASGVRGAG